MHPDYPLDEHGHLADFAQWTPTVAEHFAEQLGLRLTAPHLEVLIASRAFYQRYCYAPGMRPLVAYLRAELQQPELNSLTLLALFPGSPARHIALLAGLPKPAHCL